MMQTIPSLAIPATLLTESCRFLDVGFRGVVTSIRSSGLEISEITTQNVRGLPFRSAVQKGSQLQIDLFPSTGRVSLKGTIQSIQNASGTEEVSVLFEPLQPQEREWLQEFLLKNG
ncbi:MAG: hypothetical protein HY538_02875 [Deltaproteobacteria bacterium]|nr:hypothetical protein [Deltaproteobacteria bacterium]